MTARRPHRWLGLVLGAWFVVVGLTGATLVYWHGLEEVKLRDGMDHARAWFRALHEGRVFGEAHRRPAAA